MAPSLHDIFNFQIFTLIKTFFCLCLVHLVTFELSFNDHLSPVESLFPHLN
jgi:hypothetical protein